MILKPGDKVRITKCTDGHRYKIGSIVTIKKAWNTEEINDITYECEEIAYGTRWYISPEEYEIIPPPLTLKLIPL